MGGGSEGHCNSVSKLHRRNVVNMSMQVLCSIFCDISLWSGCTVIIGVKLHRRCVQYFVTL